MDFNPVMWALCKQSGGGSGGGGDNFPIGDGNTHIWISPTGSDLSYKVGIGLNGTAVIDWGDGTEFDTFVGTSITSSTWKTHQYAKEGDYVINLMVDGEASAPSGGLSGGSSPQRIYVTAIELGSAFNRGSDNLFNYCYNLEKVDCSAFGWLYKGMFQSCGALRNIRLPQSVSSGSNTSSLFYGCSSVREIIIPDGITELGDSAIYNANAVVKIIMPQSVTSIKNTAIYNCASLLCIDFTKHTAVPALGGTNTFQGSPTNCIFLIPTSLYDEWIAATNWSAVVAKYTFVGV